jgi:tetratricopeptide (TPR) repeat protein
MADLYAQSGDPKEAASLLDRMLKLRPGDAEAWSTRGALLSGLGRSDEAAACYQRAVEANPRSAVALRNAAINTLDREQPADALALLDRALDIDYDNSNAWYCKGVCLARLGRVPEAVEAFRRAVAINPEDLAAWKDLGRCLTWLTRYKEASEAWAHADLLEPGADDEGRRITRKLGGTIMPGLILTNDALASSSLPQAAQAYAFFQHGDFAGAAAQFDAALALDPTKVDMWVDRGICAEELEGPAKAIEFFDRGLDLDPESIGAWYNRGVSLMRLNRHHDAIAAFEKTLTLHRAKALPPDTDLMHAHHNLGSALVALGRSEDALDNFDEVVRIARADPESWSKESRRAEEQRRRIFELLSDDSMRPGSSPSDAGPT